MRLIGFARECRVAMLVSTGGGAYGEMPERHGSLDASRPRPLGRYPGFVTVTEI
jgi:hypothetical protein